MSSGSSLRHRYYQISSGTSLAGTARRLHMGSKPDPHGMTDPKEPDQPATNSRSEGATWDPQSGVGLGNQPWTAEKAPTPPREFSAGDRIAGRYELLNQLGAGGFGSVWEARDLLDGSRVAVKLSRILRQVDRGRARAEVTALRRLRLPGVVAFRDEGEVAEDSQVVFVVMDLVEGAPLFNRQRTYTWAEIAPRVLALLEILSSVHLAGVVHRDIKPANILLDALGRPVLLDFGLAIGKAVADKVSGHAVGTIRYASPEQLCGMDLDPRADLYSLGIMVYQALTGTLPHGKSRGRTIIRARVKGTPNPIGPLVPGLPAAVASVVDALVARSRDDRPASAIDALIALGGQVPGNLNDKAFDALPADRPATPQELRFLFAGPDGFFHLVEDGAKVLYQRTGGDHRRVGNELSAWIRSGLAHWNKDQVVVDRVALDRLQQDLRLGIAPPLPASLSADARTLLDWCRRAWPETTNAVLLAVTQWPPQRLDRARQELFTHGLAWQDDADHTLVQPQEYPGLDPVQEAAAHMRLAKRSTSGTLQRLYHLQAGGAHASTVTEEALATVQALRVDGRIGSALAVLDLALALARAQPENPHEAALVVQYVKVSLARENTAAADRALYELGRTRSRTPTLVQAEQLVRVWRAIEDRDHLRATDLLRNLPPFDDEDLEIWRGGAMQAIAKRKGPETTENELERLKTWAQAGGEERLAKWHGWLGNLRYSQGRFAQAAPLHLEAAKRKRCLDARLASLLDAAWDLLDGQDPDQAVSVARSARSLARRLGHPTYEAQAVTILRAAMYRGDTTGAADPSLVEAAAPLGPSALGLIALTEAAVAWRDGQSKQARALALTAMDAFARASMPAGERLVRALAFALGAGDPSWGPNLVRQALVGQAPGIDVQVLGLVGKRDPELVAPCRQQMVALAQTRPAAEWGCRREILSLQEALGPP
ncbi:MAG: serine/threonine protein kinase [Oligoflexia bacterium]|nr:serine/threonine protein kinase [Oligoflexia bacterium]